MYVNTVCGSYSTGRTGCASSSSPEQEGGKGVCVTSQHPPTSCKNATECYDGGDQEPLLGPGKIRNTDAHYPYTRTYTHAP